MDRVSPDSPWLTGFSGEVAGPARLHFRLWQIQIAALTVLAAAWLATLGLVPAVLGLLAAKHVLVAVLMAGLGGETGHGSERPACGPGDFPGGAGDPE